MAEETGQNPASNLTPGQETGTESTTTPAPQAGATSQSGQDSQRESFDAEYVRKLRDEAASYRKRAQQAETDLKKRTDAEMTETQKLQAERDAITAERDELRAQARTFEIQSAAARLGAPHPEIVARLVPSDAEDINAALTEVRKAYPAFFRTQTGSADGGTSGRPPVPSMNDFIRRSAGRS